MPGASATHRTRGRKRDLELVAQWLVRTTSSLILIDWPGDLDAFLAELLVPALTPPAR